MLRGEQRHLRRQLFGKRRIGTCAICHEELPVELLVAAHLKKRSRCTDNEKRDLTNVATPMCKLGCDELYERGFIGVDGSGIIVSPALRRTPAVDSILDRIAGTTPTGMGPDSDRYFEWHRNNVFKA